MIKSIFTLLICLFTLTAFSQEQELYRVHDTKYVHGRADEAIEIGMNLFQKAYEAIGINVQVYRYRTGSWDSRVVIPLKSEDDIQSAFFGPANTEVYQEMIKIAGSAEKVKEISDRFHSMVVREEHQLMQKITAL